MNQIVIDKNYQGLIEKDSHYLFEGDLSIEANVVVRLDKPLVVGGYIWTGGGNISTGGGDIRTGGYIWTGGGNISTGGGDIRTGGNIWVCGGYLSTGGGYLRCKALYWSCTMMPDVPRGKMQIGIVRPNGRDRNYWEKRLGVELPGCYEEIAEKIVPLLPDLLKLDKWSETERWIMESWLPKEGLF